MKALRALEAGHLVTCALGVSMWGRQNVMGLIPGELTRSLGLCDRPRCWSHAEFERGGFGKHVAMETAAR